MEKNEYNICILIIKFCNFHALNVLLTVFKTKKIYLLTHEKVFEIMLFYIRYVYNGQFGLVCNLNVIFQYFQ